MSRVLRDAIDDAHEQYDALLTHLSVIRDVVRLGRDARSFEELCAHLATSLVTGLGYEQVVVVSGRQGAPLDVTATYSQAERFGDAVRAAPSPVLITLARDVIAAGALVRWGGEGTGARRALPYELSGSVVGFPLLLGGECVGAVLGVRVVPGGWDLARQRALELVADIIDQVVTVAQMRLVMRDVQRGLENDLGSSRARLVTQEATLREQSQRITELAASLGRSNRAKSTFLALMSHELRTPLSVILGFGSILRDGLAGPVTPQQEEYLDRIFSNARHLHQLVEDMLFFVDAETARITPSIAEVDVAELVRAVTSAIPRLAAPDGPTLAVAIAPDASLIRSDADLLRRVLFHVLGNAFKFTEQGEVRIEVARASEGTEIRILDTGIGIPPERMNRVFELFRQGDDRQARRHEGIGLGLNLVRVCLGLLRGECRIVPRDGGGTRVEIRLPEPEGVAPEAETSANARRTSASLEGRGRRRAERTAVGRAGA